MKENIIVETDRLLLRRYEERDLEDLFEYLSDPEVVKFEPYQPIVRRHIVGGTNRTLISVILPPRLHSPVGDRRLLAGQPHAVVALFQRQDSCF